MAYLEQTQSRSTAKPLTVSPPSPRVWWPRLERWLPLLILVGLLAAWEMAVHLRWVDALFFPAPLTIARALGQALRDGSLVADVAATLTRLGTGLLIGGSLGVGAGVMMGWSRRLYSVCDPFVAAFYPLPKIALLPLAMLLFGIGESSKIVLIAVSSFFPMLINTLAGIQQIAPIYWEVAANYGARRGKLWTRVLIPGSLPLLLTGLRIALNTALIVTLSVELLTTRTGLGALIWSAWQTMRLHQLYAALVMIALLGYSFNRLIAQLAAYLAPWQRQPLP